ncbi:unnamed protein product [marine sediment metagenome]|uniref:Uncharacterized protein n=1 Tax=marine sediment metagenome TaxID=412755 RepID=X1W331_9ZZZZ
MKCPMLTMYAVTLKTPEEFKDRDCLKEECAWWNSEVAACSVVSLVLELSTLSEIMAGIKFKMPHEEQFRK